MTGLVTRAISSFYYIKTAFGDTIECRAKGALKRGSFSPCVGDIAIYDETDNVIIDIAPRRNYFTRPPLSNLDVLAIVVSTKAPKPNFVVLDTLLAICIHKDIKPVIIITKQDLAVADWLDRYKAFEIYDNRENLYTPQKGITAFVGNSGVGKSTLLSGMFGLNLKTGETSKKLGRGKHTTRTIELYEVAPEVYVADTPGFGTADFASYVDIPAVDVQNCFPEITEIKQTTAGCKYDNCAHLTEPNCAVKGKIPQSRYDSYITLYEQMKIQEGVY
jgi:ribosome small subunit-dependent GTPase A